MRTYTIVIALLVLVMIGCTPTPKTTAATTEPAAPAQDGIVAQPEPAADPTTGTTQIANPASVYCGEHGGTLQIKDGENGQFGLCTLSDGTVCEEWAYMRGECPAQGCGPCPQLTPPSPEFCKDGVIMATPPDSCGCQGPPRCVGLV